MIQKKKKRTIINTSGAIRSARYTARSERGDILAAMMLIPIVTGLSDEDILHTQMRVLSTYLKGDLENDCCKISDNNLQRLLSANTEVKTHFLAQWRRRELAYQAELADFHSDMIIALKDTLPHHKAVKIAKEETREYWEALHTQAIINQSK